MITIHCLLTMTFFIPLPTLEKIQERSGGVLIYIANEFNFKIRHDLNLTNCEDYESIFVESLEIESYPKHTIVGTIYRPPDKCPQPFIK